MTAPRWLDLDGTHNVRDVGGLRAGEGVVRSGVLLRGDHLEDLTAAGAAHLCDVVGLRAVVDLRAPAESPVAGAWMDGRGIDRLHLPLVDMARSVEAYRTPAGELDMAAVYRVTIDEAGPLLAEILRFVVATDHTPVLVHCAAGKDRTGIVVAVLLAAAGVDEAEIVADYAVTGMRLDRVRAALARRDGVEPVPWDPDLLDPAPIRVVLEALDKAGGAAEFLLRHGAADDELARWRKTIVEESA
jgi:protein-tyrosine phosphatase